MFAICGWELGDRDTPQVAAANASCLAKTGFRIGVEVHKTKCWGLGAAPTWGARGGFRHIEKAREGGCGAM